VKTEKYLEEQKYGCMMCIRIFLKKNKKTEKRSGGRYKTREIQAEQA